MCVYLCVVEFVCICVCVYLCLCDSVDVWASASMCVCVCVCLRVLWREAAARCADPQLDGLSAVAPPPQPYALEAAAVFMGDISERDCLTGGKDKCQVPCGSWEENMSRKA